MFTLTSALLASEEWKDDLKAELSMSVYEEDTTAAAVVLSDIGKSFFDFNHPQWGIELRFERTTRIKVINKQGYDWANITIPLYRNNNDDEKLIGLKGVTYNLVDGKIEKHKLAKSEVHREESNENQIQIKLTMPEIREGSVFEVSYSVSSPFIFNLQSWFFQKQIPVIYSEYEVATPEYLVYNQNMRGYHPIIGHEPTSRPGTYNSKMVSQNKGFSGSSRVTTSQAVSYTNKVQKWSVEKMPSFIVEPYTNSDKNYLSAITFELSYTNFPGSVMTTYTNTWESINQKFMQFENFGLALKKVGFLKKEMQKVLASTDDPIEKLILINNHLKQTVKWDGKNRCFASSNLRNVYEKGVGNSADINLLQVAMLREAGITAMPVVLSTRDHGIIFPTNPTITSFNYVVAAAYRDQDIILLDATDPQLSPGMLPFRCLNGRGRLIDENNGDWVSIRSQPYVAKTMCDYIIEEDQLVGRRMQTFQGRAVYNFIKNEDLNPDPTEFAADMEENEPGLAVQEIDFIAPKKSGDPIKIKCDVVLADQVTLAGDMMYISPLTTSQQEENPFKLKDRAYPVDYGYAQDKFHYLKLTIPAGFSLESVPESLNISLPEEGGNYIYEVKQTGDFLTIIGHLKIHRSFYTPDEYPALRKLYDLMTAKQAEQLVFKKL